MSNAVNCPNQVSVFAFRKADKLPVQLSVSPEILDLSDCTEKVIPITWVLKTKGYSFPKDAVIVTSPEAERTFDEGRLLETESGFPTFQKNVIRRNGLAFAYTICVVDDKTKERIFLDPGVQVPPQ